MRSRRTVIIIFAIILAAAIAAAFSACKNTEVISYTVKFEENGGSAVNDVAARKGAHITFPADPVKLGYEFMGWYYDESLTRRVNENVFTVTGNLTLYARWKSNENVEHRIVFSSVEHGTISASVDRALYNTVITIIFTPENGYRVDPDSISVTSAEVNFIPVNSSQNGSLIIYTFNMPMYEATVYAEFELAHYKVSVVQSPDGLGANGAVYPDKPEARMGEKVDLNIVPEAGYRIKDIYINSIQISEPSFIMSHSDSSVIVRFEKITSAESYNIALPAVQHGTVTLSENPAPAGKFVYVTATPAAGYYLYYMRLDGSDIGGAFLMPDKNVNLEVSFMKVDSADIYSVNIENAEGGTVSAGGATFLTGSSVTVTPVPDAGYFLDAVYVDNKLISGNTFTMPKRSVTVRPVFKRSKIPVSLNVTAGGIVYTKSASAIGELVPVFPEAYAGFALSSFTVNGIGAAAGYFVTPEGGLTINAAFTSLAGTPGNYYEVSAQTERGTVTPDKSAARSGEIVFLEITPDENYRLKTGTLKVNGEPLQGDGYFVMPDGNAVITAEFERIYGLSAYETSQISVYPDRLTAAAGEAVRITYYTVYGLVASEIRFNGAIIENFQFAMPAADVTFSATVQNKSSITYAISAVQSAGGTVTPAVSSSIEGADVSVTVEAGEGYKLTRLYYTYNDGGIIREVDIPDTFQMPPRQIIVRAVFEEAAQEGSLKELYLKNRLSLMTEGFEVIYTDNASDIGALFGDQKLYSLAGKVNSALTISYNTSFTVFECSDMTSVSRLAQGLYYRFVGESEDNEVIIRGNLIILSFGGNAEEDLALARGGVHGYGDFVYYERADGSYGVIAYKGGGPFAIIPDSYADRAVTLIAPEAFKGSENKITSLNLGAVRYLEKRSIGSLTRIKYLDLSSVVGADEENFRNLTALEGFYSSSLNETNRNKYYSVNGVLFQYKGTVGSNKYYRLVRYPSGRADTSYGFPGGTFFVDSIEPYAFYAASHLAAVDLKTTFAGTIGEYAFKDCINLVGENSANSINLGNVSVIKTGAFENCPKVVNVDLGSVILFGPAAFTITTNNLYVRLGNKSGVPSGENPVRFAEGATGTLTIECYDEKAVDLKRKSGSWSAYSDSFTLPQSEINNVLVMFETFGGNYISSQKIPKIPPSTVDLSAIHPVKAGMTFSGEWYTDRALTVPYVPNTAFVNRVNILYAKFI
jgi:Listeria/Bacterioides repeat